MRKRVIQFVFFLLKKEQNHRDSDGGGGKGSGLGFSGEFLG